MTVDIIVVGGGLSGMAAAYEAHKAGRSVLVLEARDRVGGRTYTRNVAGGGRLDLGGAWINEFTQPNIGKLAKEAGLALIPQSIHGTAVVERALADVQEFDDHGTLELDDTVPEADRLDEQRVIGLLEGLCKLVDMETPWTCARAVEFDSISMLAWLESVGAQASTKESFSTLFRLLFALELNDVSFLYTLHYFVCGGGYQSLASNDDRGGQFQRFRNGSMSVSEYIHGRLPAGSVLLSTPVQSVSQEGEVCIVVARGGGVYTGAAVVCTIPSPLYSTITWQPQLPAKKRSYAQRGYMGACTKVALLYDRPWWREAGYSGLATSLVGPIVQIMDTSDGVWPAPDSSTESSAASAAATTPRQYSLSCFPMAQIAFEYAHQPRAARLDSITQHVARLFPRHAAEALAPVHIVEQQWFNEAFSGGAPVPVLGCGAMTAVYCEARTPHGRVFFGGTEMALLWKGYMDGAVSAGQEAAKGAMALLPTAVNGSNGVSK